MHHQRVQTLYFVTFLNPRYTIYIIDTSVVCAHQHWSRRGMYCVEHYRTVIRIPPGDSTIYSTPRTGKSALYRGGTRMGHLPRVRPPGTETSCTNSVWFSCCRSSSDGAWSARRSLRLCFCFPDYHSLSSAFDVIYTSSFHCIETVAQQKSE